LLTLKSFLNSLFNSSSFYVLAFKMHLLLSAFVTLAAGLGSKAQAPTPIPLPGVEIHPNGQFGKCIEVRGGVFENGTPVQMCVLSGHTSLVYILIKRLG
jgi:hypothetical protein